MLHGTYVGPIAHLQGATALLQEREGGTYLAQFDNIDLCLHESANRERDGWGVSLGFGWRSFLKEHFRVGELPKTEDCYEFKGPVIGQRVHTQRN